MSATDLVLEPQNLRVEPISAPPLRVSFSWTLAGNIIYAVTQFGVLSILAKLGNPAVVGQYALALAITAPVFMFTNLQLRGVQATDARHEYQFADYFTLRCLTTLQGVFAISIIVLVSHYDPTAKLVILLVTSAKAIETFSDVIAGHLQKCERLDQVARALMIRGVASVTVVAIVFWLTRSLIAAVLAQTVAWLTAIVLYDFRVVARLLEPSGRFLRFSPVTLKSLVGVSWPLGIVMMLLSLNSNVPRYILENKLGVAELGIFASLAYMLTAINLIVLALGQSVSARLSRLYIQGEILVFKAVLRKLVISSVCLGTSGVLLTIVAGGPALAVLFGKEYALHTDLLMVLVLAASVGAAGAFLGYGITAARCFREQIPVTVAMLATTSVATFLLLPCYGLLGAGYALLAAAAVQVISNHLVLQRRLRTAVRDSLQNMVVRPA